MGCPLSPKFSPSPKYSEALALDAVEPFDLGWGKRIKDQAVSFVHVRNGFHILFIKNEIPDTGVFFDAFPVDGLGNHGDSALDVPAEHDLCRRLAVFLADSAQEFILENPAHPFGKRCPCLWLDAAFPHDVQSFLLLAERVHFHLIDHGRDACITAQINQPAREEVAYADSSDLAVFVEFLHCPP